jgi:benzoyl-CoA reductase subunit B
MKAAQIEDRARMMSRLLVERYYRELSAPEFSDRKVVYLFTSGGIGEFFRTFNFRIVLPEINAVHCARAKISKEMIRHGEALGHINEMCTYVKSDLGLMVGPPKGNAPFGKIPPPDLVVINHCGCSTYIKWGEALAREFNCPVHIIDVPFLNEDHPTESEHRYVRGQIEELVPVCEEISGVKFDQDRLQEVLKRTEEAIRLWVKLLQYGKKRPSPFDCYFEGVVYMAPMTIWRGTSEAIEYYELLIEQMEQRLKANFSPVGKERFRLVFEGSPPWPTFTRFRTMFERWGAVAVASTYIRVVCACEGLNWGPDSPMDYLADLAAQSFYNWNHLKKIQFIENLAKDYEVDGIVAHSVRSCRPISIGQLDLRKYFATEAGIPTLFVDSDIADPSFFSSSQVRKRVNTFFEALDKRRKRAAEVKKA